MGVITIERGRERGKGRVLMLVRNLDEGEKEGRRKKGGYDGCQKA